MSNKPSSFFRVFIKRVLSYLHSFSTLFLGCMLLLTFIVTGCKFPKSKVSAHKANSTKVLNSDNHGDISDATKAWVGTWSTAPQLVEPHNLPPDPGLSNNTLRQIVRISIGGDSLRVRFSNEFSSGVTTMKSVQVAVSKGSSSIDTTTIKELKFNGKSEVTMNPGVAITSDPISFNLKPRMDLAITIHFGQTSPDVTGHPGSRTTSFLGSGNKTLEMYFKNGVPTDHWYAINGIDVKTLKSSSAVVIIGNSITDGRGSGTNKQNRWPDILAERLLKNQKTKHISVLNMGIGGNCVLKGGLGPTALDRFERDILKQHGIQWLIILEGVNDIGGTHESAEAIQVAKDLIVAYGKMIDEAHSKGIKVYGGTITPIKNSFYYTDFRETARNTVNKWIRNSGRFDAIIDFDKALRSPKDTLSILPELHSGDFLHPNEAGYKTMGEAINLKLFE